MSFGFNQIFIKIMASLLTIPGFTPVGWSDIVHKPMIGVVPVVVLEAKDADTGRTAEGKTARRLAQPEPTGRITNDVAL